MRGVSRRYLTSYLDEFTCRKNASLDRTDAGDNDAPKKKRGRPKKVVSDTDPIEATSNEILEKDSTKKQYNLRSKKTQK